MFEFSKAINDFADNIISVPGIHRAVNNPIYTALTITFIIVLIIMFTFRNADTPEPLLTMMLRSGVYIFLFMLGAVFLHDHILMKAPKANDIFNMKIVNNEYANIPVGATASGLVMNTGESQQFADRPMTDTYMYE